MCFGDKLDESQIDRIKKVERVIKLNYGRYNTLNLFPKLTKILLRKRWEEFLQLRRNQEEVIIPFIEARRKIQQNKENRDENKEEIVVSYVDTLLELELPDEKRKLTDTEMVTIASEFINGGSDTTSTALQWIMANLVKYPEIQNKLLVEMKGVMGDGSEEEVKEEDLGKLPYLKAVILEGLRRHPPAHFLLPHAVKEETKLGNYVIPKNGTTNYMVAEMGRDPKVWEDPMAFKPERFMKGGEEGIEFDITGSKEIKMMPFGAGRRMCPGFGLAILHLEYFVANLVWRFEWKAVDGDEVDLSEKVELTIVMKKPLQANLRPRF